MWIPIPLLLITLDLGFNAVFWGVPKLSGTLDDYRYQFFLDQHALQSWRSKDTDEVRILAFGSSVAGAFDPYQIDGLLEDGMGVGRVDVRRLLHPGIKPSDFRTYWASQLESIDPDVLVVVFNLVDFLNPGVGRDLKPAIRHILPPWPTLRLRSADIPRMSARIEMLLAGVSNLYRYRKAIESSLGDHVKALSAWWRDGGVVRPFGVFSDGYTKPRFSAPSDVLAEVFVDPRWIEQRGRATVVVQVDGDSLRKVYRRPGWQRLLSGERASSDALVEVHAEGGWSPAASGDKDTRLLGLRLRQPQEDSSQQDGGFRYPPVRPTDIKPFRRMGAATGRAYVELWNQALEADTDFGNRFRVYREAKRDRAREPFSPQLEYAEVREMVQNFVAAGKHVVMINTPESPLLGDVVHSKFYSGYLSFFRSIAASDSKVTFLDLHDFSPVEDLNDWHHLNYIGQLKLGKVVAPVLAARIREWFREAAGAR